MVSRRVVSHVALPLSVVLLFSGCKLMSLKYVLEEVPAVAINKRCGEEVETSYTGKKKDKNVTILASNTGECPIEVVERPAAPNPEKPLFRIAPPRQASVTVKAPRVDEKRTFAAKCERAEEKPCRGSLRIVPLRDDKDAQGADRLVLLDNFRFRPEAGSCERSAEIYEHKNLSGKRQRIVVNAKNTGDCSELQVDVTVDGKTEPLFTPAVGKGGDSRENGLTLADGLTATFTVKCGGTLDPTTGGCQGEVTITLLK